MRQEQMPERYHITQIFMKINNADPTSALNDQKSTKTSPIV